MKYSFILLNGETEGFLNRLQELGVVDITRSARPIDDCSAKMLDDVAGSKRLIGKLESLDYSKDEDNEAIMKAYAGTEIPTDIESDATAAFAELSELEAAKTAAIKEIKARLPWGEFDRSRLDSLAELGYTVRYYSVPAKKFSQEWAELYPLQVISEDKSTVWLR